MGIKQYESINESLYHVKHDTGLNIFIIPKKKYAKYYGTFAVRYGSIDSQFISPADSKSTIMPDGIAHFLEHKMFEQKQDSIFEKYAALGASPNAYTTFNNTAYLFTTTDNVLECTSLLFKSILYPEFTDEGVNKEREIINQEIMMYEDNPEWRVYYNLLDCLYILFPIKKQVAGTLKSVSKIDKNMLYKCYNTFYHLSNSIFLIVGDLEPNEIIQTIESSLSDIQYEAICKPVRTYPHEPVKLNKEYTEQKLNIAIPIFAIGIKDVDTGYSGKGLLKKELEVLIILDLLFGKSTDFYNKYYNSGLINGAFSSDYVGEKDYGYILIGGESDEPMKVFEEVKKHIIHGDIFIKSDSMNRIKRKLKGHYISSFNVVEHIGGNFLSYYMKEINFFDYIDVLNSITVDDLLERYENCFRDELMALSVINP